MNEEHTSNFTNFLCHAAAKTTKCDYRWTTRNIIIKKFKINNWLFAYLITKLHRTQMKNYWYWCVSLGIEMDMLQILSGLFLCIYNIYYGRRYIFQSSTYSRVQVCMLNGHQCHGTHVNGIKIVTQNGNRMKTTIKLMRMRLVFSQWRSVTSFPIPILASYIYVQMTTQ